jgi:hypothetical protein
MDHALLLGFISGCVITSGIWVFLLVLSGNRRRSAERSNAINSIASDCVSIESSITAKDFKSALSALEKIKKSLIISMQALDVYYVKYIESEISRYEKLLPKAPAVKVDEEASVCEDVKTVVEDKSVSAVHDSNMQNAHINVVPDEFEKTQQIDLLREKTTTGIKEGENKDKNIPVDSVTADDTFEVAVKKTYEKNVDAVQTETTRETLQEKLETVEIKIDKKPHEVPEKKDSEPLKAIPDMGTKIVETKVKKDSEKPQDQVNEKERPKSSRQKNTGNKDSTVVKPEKETVENPAKEHPEDFISGEDLVEKIDSFFGIKN